MAINTSFPLVRLVGLPNESSPPQPPQRSRAQSLIETSPRVPLIPQPRRGSKGLPSPLTNSISRPITGIQEAPKLAITVTNTSTMSVAPLMKCPLAVSKTNPPSTLSLLALPNGASNNQTKRAPTAAKSTGRRATLGPGCSMLDWIRLCKNTKDMAGNGGSPMPVTEEELSRHCTESDAWTSYKGKVYNITAYFRFHPGGKDDLLKAVGKDCTLLFDEAHKWVNIQSMLKRCYVGDLITSAVTRRGSLLRTRSGSKNSSELLLDVPRPLIVLDGMNRHAVAKRESESSEDALVHTPQSPVNPPFHVTDETDSTAVIVIPPSPIRKNSDASRPTVPHWDWNQNDKNIMIRIITHNKNLKESDIIADVNEQKLEGDLLIDNWIYQLRIGLQHPVTELQVSICTTKIELRLTKEDPSIQWTQIGTLLPGNDQMVANSDRDASFRSCTIKSIESITYDTKLYKLALPACSHMVVPTGYHVDIKGYDKGQEIERSYTPIQSIGSVTSSSSTCPDIQLMIKLYSDGAMSQHLLNLQEGDTIAVGKPKGTFDCSRLQTVSETIMIAAGSGFTPMASILGHLLNNQSTEGGEDQQQGREEIPSERKHHLFFANKTQKDIMWRKELDTLVKENKSLTVTHVLSNPDKSWTGCTGRITQEFLRSHLPTPPPPSSNSKQLVCICGPQPFTTAITSALMEMDYPDSCIHVFD